MYLEQPAPGPDPEPDEFSLHDPILCLWIYFDIILGLQGCPLSSDFSLKIL
jgi:hypothetical protein